MDDAVIKMAVELTIKAMGSNTAATNWIGYEDKVAKFLKSMAATVQDLRSQP